MLGSQAACIAFEVPIVILIIPSTLTWKIIARAVRKVPPKSGGTREFLMGIVLVCVVIVSWHNCNRPHWTRMHSEVRRPAGKSDVQICNASQTRRQLGHTSRETPLLSRLKCLLPKIDYWVGNSSHKRSNSSKLPGCRTRVHIWGHRGTSIPSDRHEGCCFLFDFACCLQAVCKSTRPSRPPCLWLCN